MKKRIAILITALAVILVAGQTAFADIGSFNPQKSSRVTHLYNPAFDRAGGEKNAVAGSKIIPYDPTYRHGIKVIKKGAGFTKTLKGKKLSNSVVKKIGKAVPGATDVGRLVWYDTTKGLPKIAYTGFHVWDEENQTYQRLYIEVEVTAVSKSHNQPASWSEVGKPRAIAFTKTSSTYAFDGLPDVVVYGNGSADVRIKYFKATNASESPSKWGKGDHPYHVISNVTYRDIDAYQAISIKKASAKGFTGPKQRPDLNFGYYDGYYATTADIGTNVKNTNNSNYFMSFNLDKSTIDMRYTTNQIDYPNSDVPREKIKVGKPSGMYSFFGTTTYDIKEKLTLDPPEKRVSDKNESHVLNNTLSNKNEGFTYEITQDIPKYLDYDSAFSLKSLDFRDQLDLCLAPTNGGKDIKVFSGSTDITKYFTNSTYQVKDKNGNPKCWKIKLDSKETTAALKAINCNFKGGKITVKVPVKVVANDNNLMSHSASSVRTSNDYYHTAHWVNGNKYITVPNEAHTLSMSNQKNASKKKQYTNTVTTKMPLTGKHDIVIKKIAATSPSGERIDEAKEFKFTITLNNGSKFNCEILRNNGKKEKIQTALNKGYTFTLRHGDTLTIPGVPQSVKYTISEAGNPNYSPSFALQQGASSLTTKKASDSAGMGEGLSVTDTINKATNFDSIKYQFTNTKTIHLHDLNITKKVESGDTEKKFPFTVTLSNLAPNKTYETSIGNKTSDSNGKLTLNFELANNENFFINNLPDEAKYKVKESGTQGYKARFEVTEGADKIVAKNGSGDQNKGVYTPEETLKTTGNEYNISYDVYNDNRNYNDFIIGKVSKGTGANKDDEFNFEVRFNGLPENNQQYKSIGAEVYEWNGEKKVIETFPVETIASNSYTAQFTLKSGQFAAFTDIPDKVSYQIIEKGNDYIASYKGEGKNTKTNEPLPNISDSNESAYEDLTISRNIPEGMSSKMEYSFTNERTADPIYNKLKIGKTATNGSEEDFDFTASFTGLEKNHDYALWTKKGTTQYSLIKENGHMFVRSGQNTAGDPYEYAYGVPIEITRDDGEKKTIFSDRLTSETGNFEKIQDWIDYTGGDYTVNWIGGSENDTFTGKISSFVSDSSGDAEVDFKLTDGVEKEIDGIPKDATYQITESGNLYDPSYVIKRNNIKVNDSEGSIGTALTTKEQTFDLSEETEDVVHYTNDKKSYMLKTTKKEEPVAGEEFDFLAVIENLTKDKYMVMKPGTGTFEITMSQGGDITLTASNYSGTIENIPIKLIRPADNAEKIFLTNSEGKIPVESFYDWLAKDQTDAFDFGMEWNGGKIKGHFGP